jgi:uncharacterized protein (DUF2252 family)
VAEPTPHASLAERVAHGKAARGRAPRSSHAAHEPAAGRPDPVDLLERGAASRLPDLVPIRYGRMLVSPFAFFRGAAMIMASDLATSPASGLHAQLCGDAHLSNFGVFASPERRLVFDINDFDETLQGPWEWDVKRLAASLAVVGRENEHTPRQRRAIVSGAVAEYRNTMRSFAGMRNLDVWYARLEVDEAMEALGRPETRKAFERSERALAGAHTRDSLQPYDKLMHVVDGRPRIVSHPPLVESIDELVAGADRDRLLGTLHHVLRSYRRTLQFDRRVLLEGFRLVDVARRVVGVGSVGTRSWIALLLGRDPGDPLFLQLKEAQPSVLEGFAGRGGREASGERVVNGQHLMQASSDIFLGWCRVRDGVDGNERDYYGRQLRDWKGSADVDAMGPRAMAIHARMCGWTLARAHARSGDRVAIAAYLGSGDGFDRAIATFAEAYADQNERDYRALVDAVDGGRIRAVTGV